MRKVYGNKFEERLMNKPANNLDYKANRILQRAAKQVPTAPVSKADLKFLGGLHKKQK